jgi:hypothetical protein
MPVELIDGNATILKDLVEISTTAMRNMKA